jgi:basic membrane lipoprotein Med (substrate-binding protein (PBP1-ABC) superfamily)
MTRRRPSGAARARDAAPILLGVRGRADDGGWCEAAHLAARQVSASGARAVVTADSLPENAGGKWSALVGHGMEFADAILHAARANPGLPCALTDYIDRGKLDPLDNLCCIDWLWDEGAFLAGVLASHLTQTRVVGVLGGTPCRTQHLAMAGFVNGARFDGREISILTVQAGSFDDEERGARLANSMFDEGVDVLLHTADSTGRGAIRSARRRGRKVIGFMNDDDLAQDCVAGFISTDVRGAVSSLLADIAAERFRPGVMECGLSSGRQRFEMPRDLPGTVRSRVDEMIALIAGNALCVRELVA